ncbi:TPA: hypothetical protein DEP94_00275 [Candidatus Nomurabacteria bacterium]|nr:hypothetical protein [Candidatus Nomurabacteria bacterium]
MFNRIVIAIAAIISTLFLVGCGSAPVVVGVGPSRANPGTSAILVYQPPRPQPSPYVCAKGIPLVSKRTGLPVCFYSERTVSSDGTVTETSSETTPGRVGQKGHNQTGGGGSPQGLFPYMSKTDCPQIPVGGGLARCG